MQLFPSIDILGGKVVRLLRGNYDAETVYDDDPVAVARRFADAGARWIHVVDLDAARDGGDANLGAIEAICASVSGVQSGGGVRSIEDASERFAAGVHRVVIGSAAVESPALVDELAAMHPGQVAVGLDARVREVAIHGWTDETGLDLVGLAQHFAAIPGLGALVVTGIDRDGTLAGPDVDQLRDVLAAVSTPLVASGGVGSLDDLRELASVKHEGRRFSGDRRPGDLREGASRSKRGLPRARQSE